MFEDRLNIGNDVEIAKLGIGTWAWGDKFFWKYKAEEDENLQASFNYLVDKGVNFFDTAEIYGIGKSELLLGRFLRQYEAKEKRVEIGTKFAPLPWRVGAKEVVSACKDSLDRLGLNQMALYQLHWPGVWQNEAYWDGLAQCYEQGLVKSVGVSNYGPEQLKKIYKVLKSRNIPLATNQIQYSLLNRDPESNGILRTARELNVTILAYSPLAQGLLTGKYNETYLPTGSRSTLAKSVVPKITNLISVLKEIANTRDKTVSQVALNWCIAKGTVPIPGVRSLSQAEDNAGALGWLLDDDEVIRLDTAARLSGATYGVSFLQGK